MSGGSDDGAKLENAVKGDRERAKAQKKAGNPELFHGLPDIVSEFG
jgi:hypothetical protein